MRIFYVLLAVIVFVACSTAKKAVETDNGDIIIIEQINKGLNNISIKGQVTFKANDQQISGNYKAEIAGTDSLSLTLFGPMQIAAGKLYTRPDYFLFFDAFNNRAYEGTPNAQNLKSAFRIELGFQDLIKLFKGDLPYFYDKYLFDQKIEKGNLFKYKAPGEFVDFALIGNDGTLVQYQRKLQDGTMVLNVQYTDYIDISGFRLPGKIYLSFPVNEAFVTFETDKYIPNEEYPKPFMFSLPSDIKRIKF